MKGVRLLKKTRRVVGSVRSRPGGAEAWRERHRIHYEAGLEIQEVGEAERRSTCSRSIRWTMSARTLHHSKKAVHNMALVGDHHVFLSHLPMLHGPHNAQVCSMPAFMKDGEEHRRSYTLPTAPPIHRRSSTVQPEAFVLRELFQSGAGAAANSFKATVFRGRHLERVAGCRLMRSRDIDVHVTRSFTHAVSRGGKQPTLNVRHVRQPSRTHLAHLVSSAPDFDQLLAVSGTGSMPSAEELLRGVTVEILDRPDESKSRLQARKTTPVGASRRASVPGCGAHRTGRADIRRGRAIVDEDVRRPVRSEAKEEQKSRVRLESNRPERTILTAQERDNAVACFRLRLLRPHVEQATETPLNEDAAQRSPPRFGRQDDPRSPDGTCRSSRSGLWNEHAAVRTRAGIFDVSQHGRDRNRRQGRSLAASCKRISSNDALGSWSGGAQYSGLSHGGRARSSTTCSVLRLARALPARGQRRQHREGLRLDGRTHPGRRRRGRRRLQLPLRRSSPCRALRR